MFLNKKRRRRSEEESNRNNIVVQNREELMQRDLIRFPRKKVQSAFPIEGFYPWLSDKTRSLRGMEKLHQEILDFYMFIKPTSEEDILRESSIQEFKALIRQKWPSWEVKKFGSFPNKMHLPDSDVDVVIITDRELDQVKTLRKIQNELEKNQMVDFIRIIESRVPIIRTRLKKTKVSMDICANRKNGYEARKIVKKIIEDFPFIRPLIYVLKYFLRQRRLNESYTGGMSSFLLFNLLLSYIQFLVKQNNSVDEFTLGHILVGFFQFYTSEFNFQEVGISIRNGGHYYKKSELFPMSDKRSISVENFQEPDQDVGKSSYRFKKVLDCFNFARDNLYFPIHSPVISYIGMIINHDEFLQERQKKLTEHNSKLLG